MGITTVFSFSPKKLRSVNYNNYYLYDKLKPNFYVQKKLVKDHVLTHMFSFVNSLYNFISCDIQKKVNLNTLGTLMNLLCDNCFELANNKKLERSDCNCCRGNIKKMNPCLPFRVGNAFFSYEIQSFENMKGINEFVIFLLSKKQSLITYLISIILPAYPHRVGILNG